MENLTVEVQDGVAILTINRPKALNALNVAVLEELHDFLSHQTPQEGVKALILTGSGDKAFVAGADIKEMNAMSEEEIIRCIMLGQSVANALENAPFLTLAAVNGYALGGGLEIALACDFIYASENAKLGLPEVTLAVIPGFGGSQRLGRAVGTRKAKEMIMTAKIVDAQKAKELGIVNEVFPQENLLKESIRTAKIVAGYPLMATSQAKAVINKGCMHGIEQGLDLEKSSFILCFDKKERKEAMDAFVNRKGKK